MVDYFSDYRSSYPLWIYVHGQLGTWSFFSVCAAVSQSGSEHTAPAHNLFPARSRHRTVGADVRLSSASSSAAAYIWNLAARKPPSYIQISHLSRISLFSNPRWAAGFRNDDQRLLLLVLFSALRVNCHWPDGRVELAAPSYSFASPKLHASLN